MKRLLLLAIVLGSASVVPGQTSKTEAGECQMTLTQAPAIRGIRLGMTMDQALGVFPGAADDQEIQAELSRRYFGFQRTSLVPGKLGSKERFIGVKSVDLGFMDGPLNFFALNYDGPEWQSDKQFASKVAEALTLPGVDSWKSRDGGQVLSCQGFEVKVTASSPRIEIRNTQVDVNKLVRGRAEEPKEQARKAFKP